nr:tyrosine-type recombinase/integrase [Sporichthya polymorpha]
MCRSCPGPGPGEAQRGAARRAADRQGGRASKALTLAQAEALLDAAAHSYLHAYAVLSLLVGARTEELRALTWSHVDLFGNPDSCQPVPPTVMLWRSARAGGDTKMRKSRRTLALPRRCVDALIEHRPRQAAIRLAAESRWQDLDLVFASALGTQLDAHNVRRAVRRVAKFAGLDPAEWTPRELRHSFVSLLSDASVPLENISGLVGHSGSAVDRTGVLQADPSRDRRWRAGNAPLLRDRDRP